ncbi:uncharacterized protein LOC111338235 [Stylophora pistillata]|uniref:uncharacterized protein LOC111338235 n=1 Tax=Stylophora pistillata TaxID=50429 RepID=UPI000C03F32A|nr:uncharacterized protein LOC111338235 [Stylophora pistillata]
MGPHINISSGNISSVCPGTAASWPGSSYNPAFPSIEEGHTSTRNAQGKFQREGLLGPLDDYLLQPLQNGSYFEIKVTKAEMSLSLDDKLHSLKPCSSTCNNLWDGFGRWRNDTWRPYLEKSYNWSLPANHSSSGTFWVYGDSLGVRFYHSISSRALCKKLYLKCKNSYNWLYPVTTEQESRKKNDSLDFRAEKVLKAIRGVLNTRELQQSSSILLLNLGLHYPVSVNFTTFQKVIGEVINLLKETQVDSQGKEGLMYKAKIIWKSTTALCKHHGKKFNPTDSRFLTPQQVLLFSAYALSAMCQAGFDVIDVYPMTDSYPGGTLANDVVHYPDKVFSTLETLFEKYTVNRIQRIGTDDSKIRIRRCTS